jgi:hypothetical protein
MLDDRIIGVHFLARITVSTWTVGPNHFPVKMVSEAVSMTAKRPGRETNHLHPYGAEVKDAWSCTSAPPACHHDDVLNLRVGTT